MSSAKINITVNFKSPHTSIKKIEGPKSDPLGTPDEAMKGSEK